MRRRMRLLLFSVPLMAISVAVLATPAETTEKDGADPLRSFVPAVSIGSGWE